MNRILSLQVIESIGMDGETPDRYEPSTCSVSGCSTCSSYSNTGCVPQTELMITAY